ncbi:MAG TPA: DUF2341 domain-containing protein [Bacteroidales bacterium]|nr:DUF2341 domain-containing protein [Bacteroidales bacterium]
MKRELPLNSRMTRFFTALILTGLISVEFMSGQGWYGSDWQYRMPVTVSNPGSTHLSSFQVQIILTGGTGGNFDFTRALSDGSDIRVTSDNGVTLIPFWLETWAAHAEDPRTDTIWVKVPNIPAEGTTVYIYYGNAESTITDPDYVPYYPFTAFTPSEPVEMPPSGPYTKHPDNPIVPIDDPYITDGNDLTIPGKGLLAENIVYDDETGHYWMVFANYRSGSVGLVWSDDPSDPAAWHWHSGAVVTSANAPHLMKHNGIWYIYFSRLPNIYYATSATVNGTFTEPANNIVLSPSGDLWDQARVDEPYVFQRSDGTWIMLYMGDRGGATEQVGYAYSDNPVGPYTFFDNGNDTITGLCIPFGEPGSFDAGTVADPWVIEHDGTYYIGYTVSPTKSGWSTALATTTDWQTFEKQGLILPRGDDGNSFRGAVARIGDQYVFPFTGDSYDMRIATQPVFTTNDPTDPVNEYTDPGDPLNTIINDPEAVFDFYDGFSGTSLNLAKWTTHNGTIAQVVVRGDSLTLTGSGTWIRLNSTSAFGMGYIGETRARHPNAPATDMIVEYLFSATQSSWDLRLTDNYTTLSRWQWYVSTTSGNFGPNTDTNWHLYSIYRESPGTAGFMIDGSGVTVSTGVTTANLYPGLMSFGNGNQFVVDWTRVRKWAGADPVTTLGTEEPYYTNQWTGLDLTDGTNWHDADNWTNGIPDNTSNILIPDVTNQPVISSGDAACNRIVIQTGATVEIANTRTLYVSGYWINEGGTLITGSGTVSFSGLVQTIGGSSSTGFNNLIINSSVSTTLLINTSVSGNLSITGGIFDLGSYTCDRVTNGGTLAMGENTILKIAGTGTALPANFADHSFDPTSQVDYCGEAQTVSEVSYASLILSGSGVKTFPAAGLSASLLSISGSATAALPDGSSSAAGILILGGEAALSGSYGSTSSAADNTDDQYFTVGYTGIVTHNYVDGKWLGLTDNRWSNAANWYGGVPDASTDVLITADASNQPEITTDSPAAVCGNLTINSEASLTIRAGEALTVTGDMINNGTLTIESDLFANGSLIVNGTATGVVTYNRTMNTSGNLYHFFSAPVVTTAFPTTGTVWAYNEVTADWDEVTSNVTGKGYTLEKGIDMLSFTGTLVGSDTVTYNATSPYRYNDFIDGTELNYNARAFVQSADGSHSGEIKRSLDNYGGGGWNLLGNPYTSAISVSDFITANYSSTPALSQFDPNYVALYLYNGSTYRWVGLEDGWLNGTGLDIDHIQVGQGFFVLAMNDASTFRFTRSMQKTATDVLLLKSAKANSDPWPGIMLRLKYGEKESSTLLVYNENMTAGLDPGYDVGLLSSGPEVELYSSLAANDNSVNFTRQALPVEGADKIFVPIGIDSENGGEVTFSAATSVPLGSFRYWLEDRTAGTFTDLSTKSYTVTLPPKSYGTGRFYIIASTNTPTGINQIGEGDQDLRIWTHNGNIVIKGEVSSGAVCELFDVGGRKLLSGNLVDGELNTINLPSGIHGVFFVRVTDGVKVITRKIAIL